MNYFAHRIPTFAENPASGQPARSKVPCARLPQTYWPIVGTLRFQAQLGWIVGPAILVRSRTSIGKTQIRPLSALEPTLAFWRSTAHSLAMTEFERADYSVVVKHRDTPQNSWRWEIHRAGRSGPIKLSVVPFWSVATANRAGKEALKQLLDKLYS